jgi:hypothetical protein
MNFGKSVMAEGAGSTFQAEVKAHERPQNEEYPRIFEEPKEGLESRG